MIFDAEHTKNAEDIWIAGWGMFFVFSAIGGIIFGGRKRK